MKKIILYLLIIALIFQWILLLINPVSVNDLPKIVERKSLSSPAHFSLTLHNYSLFPRTYKFDCDNMYTPKVYNTTTQAYLYSSNSCEGDTKKFPIKLMPFWKFTIQVVIKPVRNDCNDQNWVCNNTIRSVEWANVYELKWAWSKKNIELNMQLLD